MNTKQIRIWIWRAFLILGFILLLYDLIYQDPLTIYNSIPEFKPIVYITVLLVSLVVNLVVFISLYISEKDWENVENFMGGYDIIVSIIGFFQRILVDLSIGIVSTVYFSLGAILYVFYKRIQKKDIPKDQLRNGLILIAVIISVGFLLYFLAILGILV
jgi:hypothetical protein